jgi:hypothetical protein
MEFAVDVEWIVGGSIYGSCYDWSGLYGYIYGHVEQFGWTNFGGWKPYGGVSKL